MQSRLGVFPSGKSIHVRNHSFLLLAHRAMDFGPSAPAMMAAMEMAMMFSAGWKMLMGVRGSSTVRHVFLGVVQFGVTDSGIGQAARRINK